MKETIVRLARKKAVLWGFWWAGALGLAALAAAEAIGELATIEHNVLIMVSIVLIATTAPYVSIMLILELPPGPVDDVRRHTTRAVLSLSLSLVVILMAAAGGVVGFLANRAYHVRKVQIRDAIDAIDSIPAGTRLIEFNVHNTDSVWIVSPIGKNSTVFAGAYVNRDGIIQGMDILRATDLFCNHTSTGYTEYKSCKELVTTKITTTKSLSQLGTPWLGTINLGAKRWRGTLYRRVDDALLREMWSGSDDFTIPLLLKSDTVWSTDSAAAWGLEYKTYLHIKYDNRTRRWKPSLSSSENVVDAILENARHRSRQ